MKYRDKELFSQFSEKLNIKRFKVNIVKNQVEVTKNSYHDDGDGIVSFPNGLCISDNNVQRNGTRYDIDTLDISKYQGQLTADHEDKLKNIIGRVEGVSKKDGRLTVNKIVYAVKQNPYARLAYDLLVGGFSNAFSTETVGPSANDIDGTLYNHELVGLSQVVCPNNYSAVINTVRNSLEKSKNDGLDITGIEEEFLNVKEENQMEDESKPVEAVEVAEVEVKEVNEDGTVDAVVEGKEETLTPADKETKEAIEEVDNKAEKEDNKDETDEKTEVDVVEDEAKETDTEDEKDDDKEKKENKIEVDNEISDAEVKELFEKIDNLTSLVEKATTVEEPAELGVEEIVEDDLNEVSEKVENNIEEDTQMDKTEIQNAVAEALKGYFANATPATAPEFKKDANSVAVADLNWKDRYNKQVNAAWEAFRAGSIEARKTLNEINEVNLNALKEAGIAKNSMTIESMGNFVIPPEMYREIIGKRTDYTAIINATNWRETDSLEFAWLKRNGDIDMKNVALCDDGNNGNLKPISEYTAEPKTGKLEEMAAVTVVCNAATRFFAVDLLADVAAGYRNDYDRKRAQLVIARLEQAVLESKQSVDYAPTTDTAAMVAWLQAISEISDATVNGTLIFNNKTFAQLKAHALEAGVNGPLSHIFTDGEIPQIFGTPFIVVPNDLMPTIESEDAIAFTVEGKKVPITHAVFYADLSEFVGYTSGGLQYDVATEASYEVNGTVRSAYQRNELVLRGSFFRGGAVKDTSRVSGIKQRGAES